MEPIRGQLEPGGKTAAEDPMMVKNLHCGEHSAHIGSEEFRVNRDRFTLNLQLRTTSLTWHRARVPG